MTGRVSSMQCIVGKTRKAGGGLWKKLVEAAVSSGLRLSRSLVVEEEAQSRKLLCKRK